MMETTKDSRDRIATRVFEVLKRRGDALTNREIYERIADELNLTEADMMDKYDSGLFKYRNMIQFGLLGLKKMGLVTNEERGLWSLTNQGRDKDRLSIDEYTDFQRKFWNEEVSKKRRGLSQDGLSGDRAFNIDSSHGRSPKERILLEILEQNKRILDYLLPRSRFNASPKHRSFDERLVTDEPYYLRGNGYNAQGVMQKNGEFLIIKNSLAKIEESENLAGTLAHKERQRLVMERKLLKFPTNMYSFEDEIIFKNPTIAGGVIVGRRINGWTAWRSSISGKTLDEIVRR